MIRREGDGLIRIEGEPGLFAGLWVRCILRKKTRCVLTRATLQAKGIAYRPLTNEKLRSQRIDAKALEARL